MKEILPNMKLTLSVLWHSPYNQCKQSGPFCRWTALTRRPCYLRNPCSLVNGEL